MSIIKKYPLELLALAFIIFVIGFIIWKKNPDNWTLERSYYKTQEAYERARTSLNQQ